MVCVAGRLEIPESELTFTMSRSSGPGGQNVNKLSTRVTLLFDVAASPSLPPYQKELILERLSGRINREGVMRVVSQRHRTQAANRETAVLRFVRLLEEALAETPERIRVDVPAAVDRRRLDQKRRRGRLKQERSADFDRDE